MRKIQDGITQVDTSKEQVMFQKVCGCGKLHVSLPSDNRLCEGLFYFNCECTSTLTIAENKTVRIKGA